MSLSPKQRDVLGAIGTRGVTLEKLKLMLGPGHGVTQALNALVRKGIVREYGGLYYGPLR